MTKKAGSGPEKRKDIKEQLLPVAKPGQEAIKSVQAQAQLPPSEELKEILSLLNSEPSKVLIVTFDTYCNSLDALLRSDKTLQTPELLESINKLNSKLLQVKHYEKVLKLTSIISLFWPDNPQSVSDFTKARADLINVIDSKCMSNKKWAFTQEAKDLLRNIKSIHDYSYSRGSADQAIKLCELMISIWPEYDFAHAMIGLILNASAEDQSAQGNIDAAAGLFTSSALKIQIGLDFHAEHQSTALDIKTLQLILGGSYMDHGNIESNKAKRVALYQKAKQAFCSSIKISGSQASQDSNTTAGAHLYLATVCRYLGEYQEAIAAINIAIKKLPHLARPLFVKAQIMSEIGMWNLALELSKEVVDKVESSSESKTDIGEDLATLYHTRILAELRVLMELHKNNPKEAEASLAQTLKICEAALANGSIKKQADIPQFLSIKGVIKAYLGLSRGEDGLQDAIIDLETALTMIQETQPIGTEMTKTQYSHIYADMGRIFELYQKNEDAIRCFEQALNDDASIFEIEYSLARLYYEVSKKKEDFKKQAQEHAQKALPCDTNLVFKADFVKAQKLLGEITGMVIPDENDKRVFADSLLLPQSLSLASVTSPEQMIDDLFEQLDRDIASSKLLDKQASQELISFSKSLPQHEACIYQGLLSRADALSEKGQHQGSLEILKIGAKIRESDACIRYKMGQSYLGIKNYEEAIKSFKMSSELADHKDKKLQGTIFYCIGRSWQSWAYDTKDSSTNARYKEAITAYQLSLKCYKASQDECAKDISECHLHLGSVYMERGSPDEAIKQFGLVREKDIHAAAQANLYKAKLDSQSGNYDLAIQKLEGGIKQAFNKLKQINEQMTSVKKKPLVKDYVMIPCLGQDCLRVLSQSNIAQLNQEKAKLKSHLAHYHLGTTELYLQKAEPILGKSDAKSKKALAQILGAAKLACEKAMEYDPTNQDAIFHFFRILELRGDEEGIKNAKTKFGMEYYMGQQVIQLLNKPAIKHPWEILGEMIISRSDVVEYTQMLRKVESVDHYKKALMLTVLGHKGLSKDPDSAKWRWYFEEALKALDLDQKSSTLTLKAIVLWRLGYIDQASALYEALIEQDKENLDHYVDKGGMLLSLNRLEEALEIYASITQKWPDNAEAYLQKGRILISLGCVERKDAEALLARAKLEIEQAQRCKAGDQAFDYLCKRALKDLQKQASTLEKAEVEARLIAVEVEKHKAKLAAEAASREEAEKAIRHEVVKTMIEGVLKAVTTDAAKQSSALVDSVNKSDPISTEASSALENQDLTSLPAAETIMTLPSIDGAATKTEPAILEAAALPSSTPGSLDLIAQNRSSYQKAIEKTKSNGKGWGDVKKVAAEGLRIFPDYTSKSNMSYSCMKLGWELFHAGRFEEASYNFKEALSYNRRNKGAHDGQQAVRSIENPASSASVHCMEWPMVPHIDPQMQMAKAWYIQESMCDPFNAGFYQSLSRLLPFHPNKYDCAAAHAVGFTSVPHLDIEYPPMTSWLMGIHSLPDDTFF